MPPELIHALVETKAARSRVNMELGLLAADKAEAIVVAANEVIGGLHADEFPLAVWQTGSETQTNMNVNGVLANRASEVLGGPRGEGRLVHPNDEVNLGQSSNDICPTAMHLAAAREVTARLLPAHHALHAALDGKARAFADIVKIGRTHLQDATPLTLRQEFSGYDAMVSAHCALRTLAVVVTMIANDIRCLASGPRCGLGEIELPANEPGSSIMPGKVNPKRCEALAMLAAQVMGNDVATGIGSASGNFELNVYKPLNAHNFMRSVRLLADGMTGFEKHCVRGIEARRERIAKLADQSLMLVTALTPHIGYDRAAPIAKRAKADGSSLRAAALALGDVSAEQFDRRVVPAQMVGPREP